MKERRHVCRRRVGTISLKSGWHGSKTRQKQAAKDVSIPLASKSNCRLRIEGVSGLTCYPRRYTAVARGGKGAAATKRLPLG